MNTSPVITRPKWVFCQRHGVQEVLPDGPACPACYAELGGGAPEPPVQSAEVKCPTHGMLHPDNEECPFCADPILWARAVARSWDKREAEDPSGSLGYHRFHGAADDEARS